MIFSFFFVLLVHNRLIFCSIIEFKCAGLTLDTLILSKTRARTCVSMCNEKARIHIIHFIWVLNRHRIRQSIKKNSCTTKHWATVSMISKIRTHEYTSQIFLEVFK